MTFFSRALLFIVIAPEALVALRGQELLGKLVQTTDDCYIVEIQDYVSVPKEGVHIERWTAADGKGVVFLKQCGQAPVHSGPDAHSSVIGTAVYEQGCCPDSYKCLGYKNGWFRISFDSRTGYIAEDFVLWDFVDRF